MKKTIKVIGYSEGDSEVNISKLGFELDTGLLKLTESDKKYIRDTIIRAIWELHDNGEINYWFSDSITDTRDKFGYKDVEKN